MRFSDENPPDILQKHRNLFVDLLSQEKVWNQASNPDPAVRRSVYRLLVAAVAKQKDALDMTIVSPKVLTASLHINQAGSTYDYSKALASISVDFPDAWTRHYSGSGKKSAIKRLCQFLRKGSQGGPSEYWLQVSKLLRHVPGEVLLAKSDSEPVEASDDRPKSNLAVLEALQDGLVSKDEPRPNQGEAWNAYLDVAAHLQSILEHPEERHHLLKSCVVPLLVQYIRPTQEYSRWTVPTMRQLHVCSRAFEQTAKGARNLLEEEWPHLSAIIIDDIRTSLPEKSKDYVKSQNFLSAESSRWYNIQAAILKGDASDSIRSLFKTTLVTELQSVVDIVRTRNGKPYSAASTLESAIQLIPELVLDSGATQKIVTNFIVDDIPDLLLSPSALYCIDILNHVESVLDIRQTYHNAIVKLRESPESTAKSSALQRLISSPSLNHSGEAELLGSVIKSSLQQVMANDSRDWALVMAAMGNPLVPTALTDDLLASMTDGLSINERKSAGLHGLGLAVKLNGRVVKSFTLSKNGPNLLSKLLKLSESADDNVSQQAKNITVAIEAILAEEKGSGHATRSIIEIVNKGVDAAGAESLSYVFVVYEPHYSPLKLIRSSFQNRVTGPSSLHGLEPSIRRR